MYKLELFTELEQDSTKPAEITYYNTAEEAIKRGYDWINELSKYPANADFCITEVKANEYI